MSEPIGIFGTTVSVDAGGNLTVHAIFVFDNGGIVHYVDTINPTQIGRLEALVTRFVNPAALVNGANGPVTPLDVGNILVTVAYAKSDPSPGPQGATVTRSLDLDLNAV